MTFRRSAAALALALSLAACASAPAYAPATGSGRAGYAEQRIENDRYRVSFRGGSNADVTESFALRRAAELTVQNGYEWFVVDARRTDGVGGGTQPRGSIGVGGGSGGVGVGLGVGLSLGGGAPKATTLEVRLGRGPRPAGAYDATQVLANVGGGG